MRGCGSPQERATAPGCGEDIGQGTLPEGGALKGAAGHQADTEQEVGLEGTFQLSLQRVQRPRCLYLGKTFHINKFSNPRT